MRLMRSFTLKQSQPNCAEVVAAFHSGDKASVWKPTPTNCMLQDAAKGHQPGNGRGQFAL
jgi:hypothetical protein